MTDSYEDLLKNAYSHISEKTASSERFVVPEAKAYIEGKTTILENFAEIADTVRRDKDHLMKYILGELGHRERSMATVQSSTGSSRSRCSG